MVQRQGLQPCPLMKAHRRSCCLPWDLHWSCLFSCLLLQPTLRQDVCRYRDHGAECQSPATTEKSTDAASGDFPESGPQHPDVSAEGDQVVQSMTQTSLVLRNIPSTLASNFGGYHPDRSTTAAGAGKSSVKFVSSVALLASRSRTQA